MMTDERLAEIEGVVGWQAPLASELLAEVKRLRGREKVLSGQLAKFVKAYDDEAWPIENDIGLFVDAREILEGRP